MTTPNPTPPEPSSLPDENEDDWYFDGPYLVFTEAYHRKRGFCCQSSCRHCPYGFAKTIAESLEVSEKQ